MCYVLYQENDIVINETSYRQSEHSLSVLTAGNFSGLFLRLHRRTGLRRKMRMKRHLREANGPYSLSFPDFCLLIFLISLFMFVNLSRIAIFLMRPTLCRSKQCCQVLAIKDKVMNE